MKIYCSYAGKEFCQLFVESNGVLFPSLDWEDFCIYILLDWICVVEQCSHMDQVEFKLYFMDGPYYMLCKKDGTTVKVIGVHEGEDSSKFQESISYSDLQGVLHRTAADIVRYAMESHIETTDLIELKNLIIKINLDE